MKHLEANYRTNRKLGGKRFRGNRQSSMSNIKFFLMKINGLEGMTDADISRELERGAKFIVFQYTISLIVMTFRRSSDIYYIPAGSSGFAKGLPFVLITLLFGWWGIPWGPIYTIGSLANNLNGGKDVTKELIRAMNSSEAAA